MHMYVIARGEKGFLDRWESDVEAKYLRFKHSKEHNIGHLQVAIRPIRLYEIVYPEPHHDHMLKVVHPFNSNGQKLANAIRMMMRLKKLPKKNVDKWPKAHVSQGGVHSPHVAVTGIGYKKDVFKDGIEQI